MGMAMNSETLTEMLLALKTKLAKNQSISNETLQLVDRCIARAEEPELSGLRQSRRAATKPQSSPPASGSPRGT